MNYQKIDAALAVALSELGDRQDSNLIVFVQTASAVDAAEAAFLESLGVSGATTGKQMLTATLSVEAIAQLSEQSWVRSIRLSQPLKFRNYQ